MISGASTRMAQSVIVTSKTIAGTQAAARSLGAAPNQLPRIAEPNNQGAAAIANTPSSAPPAFTRHASSHFPRIK